MRAAVLAGAVALALLPVGQATGRGTNVQLVPVVSGLRAPLYVTAPSSEPNRLYVVEQAGVIRVIARGKLLRRPFLDIRSRVRSGGNLGLFSIAFHPHYASNHRFYVDYSGRHGNVYVVELRARGGVGLPSSARVILRFHASADPASHDGGQLAFGPDGRLYVGTGDGFDGAAAQDPASLLGKVLRIEVDDPSAAPEVYAYGLRNPWRFSFDPTTGDLYIGDVGGGRWEEIDRRPRGNASPSNFGWSAYEGREHVRDTPLGPDAPIPPIAFYPHRKGGCTAVIGGYVYRGRALPAARGRYFYGDLCSGRVWSVRIVGGKATAWRREPIVVPQLLASFGEDAAGELYAVSLAGGTVYRIARGG
jgi:glucose/arabinose dehydrogenase